MELIDTNLVEGMKDTLMNHTFTVQTSDGKKTEAKLTGRDEKFPALIFSLWGHKQSVQLSWETAYRCFKHNRSVRL